jgi:hypothetical protein
MIRAAVFLLPLMLAVVLTEAQQTSTAGPDDTPVSYQVSKKSFPCKWRKKRISPEYSQLADEEIPRMQSILDSALHKYPSDLLERNLKKIYVVKTLSFFGLDYGGTYYKKDIYISNNGIEKGFTDAYLEGTFHHEFSSILLKRHVTRVQKQNWKQTNPEGFSYGNGGVEALRSNETGLHLEYSLFEKGFLNQYSLASLEEDWNCYAEYIFVNDPGFWEAWEEYEAIRKKTAILIGFYNALDPMFTLEYFRGL